MLGTQPFARSHCADTQNPECHIVEDLEIAIRKSIEREMKLITTCLSCEKTAKFRCTRCKMAYYCCRACQNADYTIHKESCRDIQQGLATIQKAKDELIAVYPNVFIEHIGAFWNLQGARADMQALLEHMLLLSNENTIISTYEAIQYGKHLLELGTEDFFRVRNLLPPMYLRIGSHDALHECYRFLHVWNSTPWGRSFEMSRSVFHIPSRPEKEIIELIPPGLGAQTTFGNLHHIIAMTAIKTYLCAKATSFVNKLDYLLRASSRSTTSITLLRGNALVLTNVAEFLRPSFDAFKLLSIGELRAAARALANQVQELLNAGHARNPLIWKALLHAEVYLSTKLPSVKSRSNAANVIRIVWEFAPFLQENPDDLKKHFDQALSIYTGESKE